MAATANKAVCPGSTVTLAGGVEMRGGCVMMGTAIGVCAGLGGGGAWLGGTTSVQTVPATRLSILRVPIPKPAETRKRKRRLPMPHPTRHDVRLEPDRLQSAATELLSARRQTIR